MTRYLPAGTAALFALFLCMAAPRVAGAPARKRPRPVADEPRVLRWVLGVGQERALPQGTWVIDSGEGNVELAGNGGVLRGLRIGRSTLRAAGLVLHVVVARSTLEDAGGGARGRAFFAPRDRFGSFTEASGPRVVLRLPRDFPGKSSFRITSYDASGAFVSATHLDEPAPCPSEGEFLCVRSPSLRIVPEAIEVADAREGELGIEARLGGALGVAFGSEELARFPVCLPGEGLCGYTVAVAPILVRASAGGHTVFHGAPEGEEAAYRERLERVLRPWESCGIRVAIGPVRVVDPPRVELISFGLPFGLPSDGREILELRAGRQAKSVTLAPGLVPRAAAEVVHRALASMGIEAVRRERPWLPHEENPAAELEVKSGGVEARVRIVNAGRLALTRTIPELRDGLDHFDDARAASGSEEERALLLPLVDRSDATVDVVAVPFFSDGRRVGESFVAIDDPALVNVIVVDRSGLAGSRTSHVVAHELGHVLLRSGDHPDEGSRDTPRLLMDSDASDASRFGPRLLTQDECVRARHQGSSDPHRVLFPIAR